MYTGFQLAKKYFQYWVKSSNSRGHGVHSPFVFDFITQVLNSPSKDKILFKEIELLRKTLRRSEEELTVVDLGAGSVKGNATKRTVGSIAKNAAKSPKFGQLLYKMAVYYRIETILELGTSLGLTTRYLALANPVHGVISIEGSPEIAEFARQSFIEESKDNIELIVGDFSEKLENALVKMKGRKMIFFDGNHQYQSTLDYFNQSLKYCGDGDIMIFDDIHWSKGMEKAWQEIKNFKEVSRTIDLFFVGVVFFRKEFKEKLEFSIRF
jgi:predicted O-methyltransferase YrrM